MKRLTVSDLINLTAILLLVLLATACSSGSPPPTSTPTPSAPTPSGTVEANNTTAESDAPSEVAGLVAVATTAAERTPLPSPTPGPIDSMVEGVAEKSGVADKTILGLTGQEWIDLFVSVFIVIISYFLVVWLFLGLLKWAVRQTKTQFDDELLDKIGRELKWLILIVVVRWAVERLDLLSDELLSFFDDLFFLLIVGVLTLISMRLVAFSANWYQENRIPEENRKRLAPIMVASTRLGYLFVFAIALSIILSHLGVELTLLSAIILFVAVLLGIGAKEAISDAVSGFLILVDQPFSVGDVILIKELDTRGTVGEIGIRSTSMRTRDGRDVIVPNSLIATSQVVNYSHPDPSYRVQIEFIVDGGDFDQLDLLIKETIRGIDGVLSDRPVDVLYLSFAGSAIGLRVYWWIDHVYNQNFILDRVKRALEIALADAGIETPDLLYVLNMTMPVDTGFRS